MEIHFISSLTVDDESRIAAALLGVATCLLDQFAIAYSLRIETTDGAVFQRTQPPLGAGTPAVALPAANAGVAPAPAPGTGTPES